jgi:hypothetical protein
MKSRQWPLYVTTGAVVLSSLALLAALTYALSGVSWQKVSRAASSSRKTGGLETDQAFCG